MTALNLSTDDIHSILIRSSSMLAAVLATYDFEEDKFTLVQPVLVDCLTSVRDDIETIRSSNVVGGGQ